VDYLALEVGLVQHVIIYQTDMTNPGSSKIESHRGTKTTRPDNKDRSCFELALTVEPNLRDEQVAGITQDLSARKFWQHVNHLQSREQG
jgi:hypothetical protein